MIVSTYQKFQCVCYWSEEEGAYIGFFSHPDKPWHIEVFGRTKEECDKDFQVGISILEEE